MAVIISAFICRCSLVNLDNSDSLVNEWNLIILSPDYASMVLCHELSPEEYRSDSQPQIDTERKFYGLWTFDRDLVEKAARILIERLHPYNPSLAADLSRQQQEISQNINPIPTDLTGVVSRIVTYLPDGCTTITTDNTLYYNCSGIYYQPLFENGSTVYQVVRF